MRFRKRLSAAVLAAVMMLSSVQIPGGTSYAAEIAGDGITSGQDAPVPATEETEGAGTVEDAKTQPDESAITDDSTPTGEDSQTDNGNPTGDDSQTAADDSQKDDENVSEEETDAGQVSDDDTEEPSVDTEEPEAEEAEEAEAEVKGIYQMDDMTSDAGGITPYALSSDLMDWTYKQMLERRERIDFSEINCSFNDMDEVKMLLEAVVNEHPDLYYYNGYGVESSSEISVYYSDSYDDAAFNAKVDEALSYVTDGMSDDVKAAVLHDYLALNVKWEQNIWAYDAYGALGRV